MGDVHLKKIIKVYKEDQESVYHTWFLNSKDRLKAFRTIRTGVKEVAKEMESGNFGNDFKGSSLEIVVSAISEQKQIFEGASHAFYWKPKLRIPDIYENKNNQKAFGRFLLGCLQTNDETKLIKEILTLDEKKIKGLGPAVANILYFLHPTLFPPFNTAIVNGFNMLFGRNIKLGSWAEYLKMRDYILAVNQEYLPHFSKDLGAITGILFEIGTCRIIIPENAENFVHELKDKSIKSQNKRTKQVVNDKKEENEHSEMQFLLAKLGRDLGYQVWIAQNDHQRVWKDHRLGEFSLKQLPNIGLPQDVHQTISLIDVLWLDSDGNYIGAFEVEKSTSIYSGILRLHDLSSSVMNHSCELYLIAPNEREKEIKAQLLRPSLQSSLQEMPIKYINFSDFRCDCEAMCKFGDNISIIHKIAKTAI